MFSITGIILMIIGIAGALYTGNIVVKTFTQSTDFQPATESGFLGSIAFVEMGFISVAIIGLTLMYHGIVNDPKKEIRSSSKSYR
jgi:L-asparagine transporter-like permease